MNKKERLLEYPLLRCTEYIKLNDNAPDDPNDKWNSAYTPNPNKLYKINERLSLLERDDDHIYLIDHNNLNMDNKITYRKKYQPYTNKGIN